MLDEADEMLSLGFWPDMREIASYLPKQRQSCLFSATMPEKVRSLSRVFLTNAEFVSLIDGHAAPAADRALLLCLHRRGEGIVPGPHPRVRGSRERDHLLQHQGRRPLRDRRFSQRGFDADQISGDLPQAAREKAMDNIKAGKLRFLVATDVAARGIDISDLAT